jgi:hypothetical protein
MTSLAVPRNRRGLSVTETIQVRNDARDLLGRLLIERDRMELRMAEAGRHDPLKSITGRSSLDNAIESTRQMIRHMEDLLAEMNSLFEIGGEHRPAVHRAPAGRFRA